MTTATMPPQTSTTATQTGFASTLASEWVKLRSVQV
jgi:hypothetical protein